MTTKIYKSEAEFDAREDKLTNGVSASFAEGHKNWEADNESNSGCYNCARCVNCGDCVNCTRCYNCTRCIRCYNCTRCARCARCTDSTACADCARCGDCTRCTRCARCTDSTACADCARCGDCTHCTRCDVFSRCKEIQDGGKAACFEGVYKYVCSPRVVGDVEWVQMGCFLRTREAWEADFWNNDKEFKEGSPEGNKRELAFKLACLWLDEGLVVETVAATSYSNA